MRLAWKVLLYALLLGGFVLFTWRLVAAFQRAADGGVAGPIGTHLGGMLLCLVTAGLLIAQDVAKWAGRRAENIILQGSKITATPPELQAAERVLAKGDPLEAIRLLRDYLQQHPAEVQVMSRIAAIYDEQLRNPLAAALEVESLLRHKLEAEVWAWAAVRLSTYYLKLRRGEEAVAMLQRVVTEHGQTSAAVKARKRLARWGAAAPAPDSPAASG